MYKLPVPVVNYDGRDIVGFNVKKISGGSLADARKEAQVNPYKGIHEWNCGCLESFVAEDGEEITDRQEIRIISRQVPFASAQHIALMGVINKTGESKVSGNYTCPQCGNIIRTQVKTVDGEEEDSRDDINLLPIIEMETPSKTWSVELGDEVILLDKVKHNELLRAKTLEFHYTTLGDCIRAYDANVGIREDRIRLQYALWLESLEKVNGIEVDKSWKSFYGMKMFEAMTDFSELNNQPQYGIDPLVEKCCPKCGEIFKTEISTINFFVSGLK